MEFEELPWYGQFLIVLLIGVVLIGFFYFLYYKGKSTKIETMEKDITKTTIEIRKADRKIRSLKKIEKGIVAKEEQLRELKRILPEEKEIDEILKKVQSIISSSRLQLNNIDGLKEVSLEEVLVKKPLSISLLGNFHNLAVFYDQLSELDKIFTVDNIIITPSKEKEQAYSISAKFTASTYYLIKDKINQKSSKSKKKKRRKGK